MDPELTPSDLTTEDISAASGLTPEQLAEVPDLNGGMDDLPASSPSPGQPQAQGRPPSPAQAQTIREAAAAYGLDLSSHADDHSAFVALVEQARAAQGAQLAAQAAQQNSYYTQLGQQLAPRLQDIQGFLRQQTAPAPQAQPPKPWQPPEFNKQWLNLVDRDEATGVFKAKPGISPEYAEKVQKYADWMSEFNTNPMALISQAIQAEAKEIAAQVYTERHSQFQEQAAVQGIIEQNASWIYQSDQYGRRYTDERGGYIPTPEGARYVQHVQTLIGAGVKDPRMQDQIARSLVQGEIAAANATRQTQVAAAQAPQARAAQVRPPVNAGQAVPPSRQRAVPAATVPQNTEMSLADLFRQGFQDEGITDADFALS
jgi:hypothetical protein